MSFSKFSFKNEAVLMLVFGLLPLISGILVFLALMILGEFDLISSNR